MYKLRSTACLGQPMTLFHPRGRPLSDRYKTITPLPLRPNISTAVRLAQQILSPPSPPTIDDTQKLATWVDTKNDDENLHRRLRALSAETLFAIAVLDSEAWRKVKTFAKQGIPGRCGQIFSSCQLAYRPLFEDIPTADDLVSKLPLELILNLIALLPLKERVRFSQTSHRNNGLCALLLHHETSSLLATFGLGVSEVQLMLLGSRTLLSGFSIPFLLHIDYPFPVYKLELYTALTKGEDVATYICRMGGYILDDDIFQEEVDGLLNASWVLRKGSKTITVIESMTTAGACIFNLHATPEMGFWDGNRIFHAYPTLLTTGVSLTTPHLLELNYTLQAQRHVWHILQKYSLRGFQHQFEYKAVHVCGKAFSCPGTIRTTVDGGCLNLNLPETPYHTNRNDTDIVCWTLSGTGCEAGVLALGAGRFSTKATSYEEYHWKRTLELLISTPSDAAVHRLNYIRVIHSGQAHFLFLALTPFLPPFLLTVFLFGFLCTYRDCGYDSLTLRTTVPIVGGCKFNASFRTNFGRTCA
ncbi:hypothetical protein B0H11DRAFT_1932525 [Mycena galericulata]|nr:hypothetical protein B0H11DRAFT_1932525 [Mycena galericulata]